jgi:phage shock protein A
MKENIAGRVGRIISGGFNALVDVIEHLAPEVIMEQALREIDSVTEEIRVELGKVAANKHLASKRIAEENKLHEELSSQMEIALKEKRDDLASAAIERQLDIEVQIPVLEKNLIDCSEKEKELEGYILALQAKKREMKAELSSYREAHTHQNFPQSKSELEENVTAESPDNRVKNAISAFDRVLEKHTGAGTSPAISGSEQANKLAELEKISRENRISERLAAVKANMNNE